MAELDLWRAIASAAAVGAVLELLRHAGPRAGGWAAALPINSIPALAWLAHARGGAFAVWVALGSLAGTLFTWWIGLRLAAAAADGGEPGVGLRPAAAAPRRALLPSMAAAGAMSLLVALIARHAPPALCGLVAAAPVVLLCAVLAAHRQGGRQRALDVLAGYLDGMPVKAAFLAGLGAGWAAGLGAIAWALALLAATATAAVAGRRRVLSRRRLHAGASAPASRGSPQRAAGTFPSIGDPERFRR